MQRISLHLFQNDLTLICVSSRVVDGIEDNSHAFQFNVEQSETKTNVTGKVPLSVAMDDCELHWIGDSKHLD